MPGLTNNFVCPTEKMCSERETLQDSNDVVIEKSDDGYWELKGSVFTADGLAYGFMACIEYCPFCGGKLVT